MKPGHQFRNLNLNVEQSSQNSNITDQCCEAGAACVMGMGEVV
jgi:hypothetical protein